MKTLIDDAIGKIYHFPFSLPWIILSMFICIIRSFIYSLKIDSGGGCIIITDPFINIKIVKYRKAKLCISGTLKIIPHVRGRNGIVIEMCSNSRLSINGDFTIGNGVKFYLSRNASLSIGGKCNESIAGISADTLIMVSNKIEIGKDFLCAWDIFITDSDWHQIGNQNAQADVIIGDHVWVANNNNILKGAIIGNNCIVASNSKISNCSFPENVLIGGIPPKILKKNVQWCRDIKNVQ
jgi:acetyltransferase-like isoleucine patch superfamily enzyme